MWWWNNGRENREYVQFWTKLEVNKWVEVNIMGIGIEVCHNHVLGI